ncbi:hypothetical protein, partial [Scytonema sp. HK-05]|uniref:hypothetical protein n=1 Tax=Scytonema sp. HK-05 TaxID=1137095 RepID=UPI001E30B745
FVCGLFKNPPAFSRGEYQILISTPYRYSVDKLSRLQFAYNESLVNSSRECYACKGASVGGS